MPASAITTAVLSGLNQLNTRHPWSHNDAYTPVVLHHARRVAAAGGTHAVDIGSGTGHLLRRLATVMPTVTGIEADATSAHHAATTLADLPHVSVQHATFTGLPQASADLVTLVAVLHHLPLEATLVIVRAALRPGGRIVVIGAYRETPADRLHSLVSLALNPLVGLLKHPRPAAGYPAHMLAPTAPAQETYEQIASTMRAHLPGVRIYRGLFWRYVATWTASAIP